MRAIDAKREAVVVAAVRWRRQRKRRWRGAGEGALRGNAELVAAAGGGRRCELIERVEGIRVEDFAVAGVGLCRRERVALRLLLLLPLLHEFPSTMWPC